jgi:hypothetical protein
VYYFDGRTGALLWQHHFFPENGFVPDSSLAISSDGSYIASGGPASGVLVIDSSGKVLSEGSVGASSEPVSISQSDSLVLMSRCCGGEAQLSRYNGTLVATFHLANNESAVAGSPNGPLWVDAEGWITKGACATLRVYSDTSQLPSIQLC